MEIFNSFIITKVEDEYYCCFTVDIANEKTTFNTVFLDRELLKKHGISEVKKGMVLKDVTLTVPSLSDNFLKIHIVDFKEIQN